jgi:hypothetical protein
MINQSFQPKSYPKEERDWKKYLPYAAAGVIILVIALMFFFFGNDQGNLKMVSGTEYISGEYGQVIIRLADNSGNPIEGATCSATILYPDKSYFLTDYEMRSSSQSGNYYASFMTPTINGIYEETITCAYDRRGGRQTMKVSSSFHVSPALNFVVELSKLQAERYQDLVNRLNQTQMEINQSKLEILMEINATFNKSFDELIKNQTAIIRTDLNDSKNATLTKIDDKFGRVYSDFDKLGKSMSDIFGNVTGQ